MASGHMNRVKRPDTWLHRPMLQNVKKVLANPEPSTHDPQPTSHAESHLVSAMVRGPQRERRPTSCKFAPARSKPEFPFGFETRAAQITPK
jgi:hypothetical protein